MRLRTRLLIAQIPLAAAVLVVASVSVFELRELGDRSRRILEENYRSVVAAQRMIEALERLDSAALARVAGHDGGMRDADRHLLEFEAELSIERSNVTEPEESDVAEELARAWTAYAAAFDAFRAGVTAESDRSVYFASVEPAFVRAKAESARVLALNQGAMVRKSDAARATADHTVRVLVVASAVALLAGGIASVWLTARILRPLGTLAAAAARVAEDDLDVSTDVTGDDEIAAVAREFDRMTAALRRFRTSSLGRLDRALAIAQAAVDCVPDPVLVVSRAGEILVANPAGRALLPRAGSSCDRVADLPEPLAKAIVDVTLAVERSGATVGPLGLEAAIRVGDGDRDALWFLCRGDPLRVGDGVPAGVAIVLSDVTHVKRLGRLQEDSVATVAHELRTPLTSLHMAILLCTEGAPGPLTADQAELLDAARRDCERLRTTVDDLLDLARLRQERDVATFDEVEVAELLAGVAEGLREEAGRRRVTVRVEPVDGAASVRGDAAGLQVVISNLAANAVRHAPESSEVVLRIRRTHEAVRLEVSDHGPGIPFALRERVFERFFQAETSRAGASGLGLSIAREIVTRHAGRIGVVDTPGGGATFFVELPPA